MCNWYPLFSGLPHSSMPFHYSIFTVKANRRMHEMGELGCFCFLCHQPSCSPTISCSILQTNYLLFLDWVQLTPVTSVATPAFHGFGHFFAGSSVGWSMFSWGSAVSCTFISLVLAKTHKEAMWVFPDSWEDIDKLSTHCTGDCLLHNLLTTLQLLPPPLPLDKCPKVAPLDVGKSNHGMATPRHT